MDLIQRIDREDQLSQAALQAERQLFAHFGLKYRSHDLQMTEPDINLRLLEVGTGKPVLIVPGGSGDAIFFAPLIAELTGWRLILINRPGGGLSDGVDHQRLDMRRLAVDAINSVMDAFELDRVPIICNSMGGLWSFWYTLEHPERVAGMVQLGCPALILNTSAPFMMRLLSVPFLNQFIATAMQPKDPETALEGLRFQGSSQADIDRMPQIGAEAAYHFFNLPTYLATWKSLVGAAASLWGANPRYRLGAEALRQIGCPVHFIWGENDPFGGLDVAREAVRLMPKATLSELQTGHLPFLDKPEQSGRLVQKFLTELAAQNTAVQQEALHE